MVKGMTRRIIEIRQAGNAYFEKAVFYCRIDMPKGTTDGTLAKEASRIIDRLCSEGIRTVSPGRMIPPRARKLTTLLKMLAAAVAGAAASILAVHLGGYL